MTRPRRTHPTPVEKGGVTSDDQVAASILLEKITHAALHSLHADFLISGNPLHLLLGLVTARRAGFPPPHWVLNAVTEAVEKVLAAKGKLTLDAALGLVRKKGQRTCWTELKQREADDQTKWLIEERPKLLKTKTAVSGTGGAIDQAIPILYPKGDPTGALAESLLHRYKKTLKKRPPIY